MPPDEAPLVSVVSVNYNGERYLGGLLSGLLGQSYPRFEVLLVDNGSRDASVSFVDDNFPSVRVIRAFGNLGFAAGNNLGLREARGDYVALINNDTLPDPDWLRHLVEAALDEPRIAAVGSKILFARPFVPVTLTIAGPSPAVHPPYTDPTALGVFVSEASEFKGCSYAKRVFSSGFHGSERLGREVGRWAGTQATLLLPTESLSSPGDLVLRLRGGESPGARSLTVSIGHTAVETVELTPTWQDVRVPVPAQLALREGIDLINNAASFLEADGTAGDRGIFEPDRGQYDEPEDVTALCGGAMLVSRAALNEVGGFDEDYFMYFEDTELCWRLRKAGYRLRYEPKSVVRHFHASTSVEWSPLFNFLVSRNRILMLIQHARARHAVRAYLEELGRLLKLLKAHRSFRHVDVRTRLQVQGSLLRKAPRAWLRRLGLLGHRGVVMASSEHSSDAATQSPLI